MSTVIPFPTKGKGKPLASCPPSDALSFVKRRKPKGGGGFDYWAVTPSGDYVTDCKNGTRLADEYLAFLGKWPTVGNSTLLTAIVRSMVENVKQGKGWSGLNVGFLSTVNRFAMFTASVTQGNPKSS